MVPTVMLQHSRDLDVLQKKKSPTNSASQVQETPGD